jgi:GntR family transcriptional regulator
MTAMDEDDIPVYLRLRALIAATILEGRYAEGEQLPSVRAFAATVGANPLTVAKAYQCLQDEGHVSVKRGVGMFVANGAVAKLRVQERDLFLTKIWPRMQAHIDRLGLSLDELLAREPA